MANRKFVENIIKILIGLIIICPIFVSPAKVWAYDAVTTHRAITSESAKVFNYYYPELVISSLEIDSLARGSVDEDTPPRWLNHFYDPVHQIGFRGLRTSKDWAENTTA
ncbi:MAG: hypothetical protein WC531_03555 [Candidatus Paceibacterota bacterium]|jgi:hypothetical protein